MHRCSAEDGGSAFGSRYLSSWLRGSLLGDGNELRQIAELGLAAVGME